MRDPDLVARAQRAASALEGAWHRWRIVHGLTADPMPAVSSYVGYSLEEPWGQPRVVFGLAAEDAEQLTGLLERHDCVGPIYAAVATLPSLQDLPARTGVWTAALPVPSQAPSVFADLPLPIDPLTDRPRPGQRRSGPFADYDEPVYRQAAAAMQEAAATPEVAATHEAAQAVRGGAAEPQADDAEPADARSAPDHDDDGGAEMLPARGSLAQAASAARAEAEARIKAAQTEATSEPADRPDPDPDPVESAGTPTLARAARAGTPNPAYAASAEASVDGESDDDVDDDDDDVDGDNGYGDFRPDVVATAEVAASEAGDDGYRTQPQVYATDMLEPLPRPEAASGAYTPGLDDSDEDYLEVGPDGSMNGQPDGSAPGLLKRGRTARSYPIPRLSRTKRPGAPSQPAGN